MNLHEVKNVECRRRRIADFRVLPLLALGFMIYQLDRTNIASALTGGFATATSVDQKTINLGNQLMFLGVIVLEIPSNMLLQIIGPRRWISAQVFVFGLISTLQIFIRNKTGFLVTRLLLGLAEAGYIPGSMYALSTWYSDDALTKRIAIFFFGMFGGSAVSPLLGAGLLQIDGAGGLSGWQWIFLVEGLWTICVSGLLFFLLPQIQDFDALESRPDSEAGGSAEKDAELQTDVEPVSKTGTIPLEVVWKTLLNYRKWLHFLATACVFATWSPLLTYTPTIMMSLGFGRIEANAITAIGTSLTLPVILLFAWLSDRTGRRGLIVMLAIGCYLITLIAIRTIHPHVGKWRRVALWTVVNALAVGYHPIHNAWIQVNCSHPGERSISIAMFVMTATSGLMAGAQIFQSNETALFYPRGLLIMICLVSSGFVMVGIQQLIYRAQSSRTKVFM